MTSTSSKPDHWLARNLSTVVVVAGQVVVVVSALAILANRVDNHEREIVRLDRQQETSQILQRDTASTLAATAAVVSSIADRQNAMTEDIREIRQRIMGVKP